MPDNKDYYLSRIDILGINGRNLDFIFRENGRVYFSNVDDKLKCKELLEQNGIPTPPTYFEIRNNKDLKKWPQMVEGIDDFVIKPNNSYGGRGILLIKQIGGRFQSSSDEISIDDINFHIREILTGGFSRESLRDTAFLEYKIDSSGVYGDLLPPEIEGIGDIRIIFHDEYPIMAMLRLPTMESGGRANLHQGGIGVGIELNTGMTLDGCHHNSIIYQHPETGISLTGRSVPEFRKMVEMGKNISRIVGLGYIGVDYAIDRNSGPLVLEVNARPGLNIQIANRDGLRRRLI